jgi:hypothetical protein
LIGEPNANVLIAWIKGVIAEEGAKAQVQNLSLKLRIHPML